MNDTRLKIFMLVKHEGESLPVRWVDRMVVQKEDPPRLIWCNDGLYCTLSPNTVKHILRIYRDSAILPRLDVNRESQVIYWDVMVPLDQVMAKLLFD